MNEKDLKLAMALLEQDCPETGKEMGCVAGVLQGYRPFQNMKHDLCDGTGKVPLLDPALVRKECKCGSKFQNHAVISCGYGCHDRGWSPSPNDMDWVRALNKAGYDVAYRSCSPVDEVDVYEDYDILRGWGATIFEAAAQALGVKVKETP